MGRISSFFKRNARKANAISAVVWIAYLIQAAVNHRIMLEDERPWVVLAVIMLVASIFFEIDRKYFQQGASDEVHDND